MIKGIKIDLGGEEFILPPISLGDLELLLPRIQAFDGTLTADNIATVVDCAHAALSRNYPDIDKAVIKGKLDVGNFGDIMAAVMDVGGMLRKQAEAPQGEVGAGSST